MSLRVRAVCAFILLLPLSCAGPLEEAGAIRPAAAVPDIPDMHATLVVRRASSQPPVEISKEEFAQALRMLSSQLDRVEADPDLARRRLLADAELSPELEGLLLDRAVEGRIVLASVELSAEQQQKLDQQYFRHCQEIHGRWGDCLNVMQGARNLTAKARYRLACHFALASVMDGIKNELGGMLDVQRIESAILVGVATWALLVTVPEPFSKFLAVGLTVAMVAWLGVDTLENVIGGWKEMATAVDGATTLPELRRAGEAYGTRMGAQTARLVVMLVASVIGEKGLANLPKLPKFNVATRRLAAATGGPGLEVVTAGQQATVTGSRVTIVLAKAAKGTQVGTAALAGGAGRGGRCLELTEEGEPSNSKAGEHPKHHICTDKNSDSDANGGPWTPIFAALFARAGMTLSDPANIVEVSFHQGPHPREYHDLVYNRLVKALGSCNTASLCRERLALALKHLADEIRTPGSRLNDLVTRGCGSRK